MSYLMTDHNFFSITEKLNHGKKKNIPLALRYFDLKNAVSTLFLIAMKILMKLQNTQKTADTLFK